MNVSKSKAQGKWFIGSLGIVSQESGTLVSTFPFHGTAWISWWLLAVSTGSGAVAEPGAETQSDSVWHLLSILWPERVSSPPPPPPAFPLCKSAAVVAELCVLSLGYVMQHRLGPLRAVETLPILHTYLPLYRDGLLTRWIICKVFCSIQEGVCLVLSRTHRLGPTEFLPLPITDRLNSLFSHGKNPSLALFLPHTKGSPRKASLCWWEGLTFCNFLQSFSTVYLCHKN